MTAVLAIDAGGSHTRAACIDADGTVRGWGTASGGNATSLGEDGMHAIERAARAAIVEAGINPSALTAVLCAAGEAPVGRREHFARALGMNGPESWHIVGDALGAYFSACSEPDGIVLIAGTGAIAARVQSSSLVQVVDGLGWLMGDLGSGFWIGRQVVSAVATALDGRGPATMLIRPLLDGIPGTGARWSGARTPEVAALLRTIYDRPPMALAEYAPLAFRAAEQGDAVASSIVTEAATHLATTLLTARRSHEDLPVVIAGSVLTQGLLGPNHQQSAVLLRDAMRGADVRRATDGVVGAATLALQRRGVVVSESLRAVLAYHVEKRRR